MSDPRTQSTSSAHPAPAPYPSLRAGGHIGVEIIGTGSALPVDVVSNADLEKVMDTSNEWIVQRTGIKTRHRVNRKNNETSYTLGATAIQRALAQTNLTPADLDLIICSTMTPEMYCPPSACRIADIIGAGNPGAFDLSGACSGFVYGINVCHDLIKGGAYRHIALVGSDTLTRMMDYSNAGRGTAILFGDGAGAVILRATPDTTKGIIAQAMHSEGKGWKDIYAPHTADDFPHAIEPSHEKLGRVQMNGSNVFKFAVTKFPQVIQETLDKAGLTAEDVDMFVCHQSNARILTAARERFGLPIDKLYVNIDRVGNTVAASVPLCLDELVRAGRVKPGMKVMFVAFGAGLTWASSLWQL